MNGEVYLVVAVPGGDPRWVPVADVLLRAGAGAEPAEALLARHPGVSAVASPHPGGVTLIHRNGRIAASAGARTASPAVRAVVLLRLLSGHGSRSSSRRTCPASVSASSA
ncbi:hypothetical protein [Catenuloplanes atrovinosus]|uniref:Uncharacterized protein n=1 Tax=Catenuloplanes atrovinosus TaxID=137266 RepID=A0AAE3YK52_9ACTN|nr:hypothetical protein [Catenuloplanes atrovinosus]MDR7275254.1 hypothetical protein [Catenuloplanes atrovinosus]